MDNRLIRLLELRDEIICDLSQLAADNLVGDAEYEKQDIYEAEVRAGFDALRELIDAANQSEISTERVMLQSRDHCIRTGMKVKPEEISPSGGSQEYEDFLRKHPNH